MKNGRKVKQLVLNTLEGVDLSGLFIRTNDIQRASIHFKHDSEVAAHMDRVVAALIEAGYIVWTSSRVSQINYSEGTLSETFLKYDEKSDYAIAKASATMLHVANADFKADRYFAFEPFANFYWA